MVIVVMMRNIILDWTLRSPLQLHQYLQQPFRVLLVIHHLAQPHNLATIHHRGTGHLDQSMSRILRLLLYTLEADTLPLMAIQILQRLNLLHLMKTRAKVIVAKVLLGDLGVSVVTTV
jgi:hypothetical protein